MDKKARDKLKAELAEREAKEKRIPFFVLSEQELEDLLVSAWEGGSNYWAAYPGSDALDKVRDHNEPLSTELFKAVMNDPTLKIGIVDLEGMDDYHLAIWEEGGADLDACIKGYISRENIEKAEKLMFTKHRSHAGDVLKGDDDAITADVFFQLIVLGDVIYG